MARTHDLGYGWAHQQLRQSLRPAVEAGEVDCWRCGGRLDPREAWDLGHDDHDRTQYRGPEHVTCNRGTSRRTRDRTAIRIGRYLSVPTGEI